MATRKVAVCVAVAAALVCLLLPIVRVASGSVAKRVCSAVFVQGRTYESIATEELRGEFYLPLVRTQVNTEDKTVTSRLAGLSRTAKYTEGYGCSIVRSDVTPLSLPPVTPKPLPKDKPWPLGNKAGVDTAVPGVDYTCLEKAIRPVFDEDLEKYGDVRVVRGVAVALGGKLVAESYRDGWNSESLMEGWSMSKSLLTLPVSVAIKEGLWNLSTSGLAPEWLENAGDPRADLTLDQLLRMASGLDFMEVYDPFGDAPFMLFATADAASYAADKGFKHPPDTVHYYSSGTTNLVSRALRRLFASDTEYWNFLRRVFDDVGMRSVVAEHGPSGTWVASSFTFATLRDWLRMGQLMLDGGSVNGKQILSEGWADYVHAPSVPNTTFPYGAHWHLVEGSEHYDNREHWSSLPRDGFLASGYQEQQVFVSPSHNLVVARMGSTRNNMHVDFGALVNDIIGCLP